MKRYRSLAAVVAALVALVVPIARARELSFEERARARAAVERVYWSHREWPSANRVAKPSFSSVMSTETIGARVEDSLRKSKALELLWHRPITAAQLQAEIERMSRSTKDADTLRELFAAVGDDPLLVAETLARPSLADRLIRNAYTADDRFHGARRREAESARALCASADCMKSIGGEYRETRWLLDPEGEGNARVAPEGPSTERLGTEEWTRRVSRLAADLGAPGQEVPVGPVSRLLETANGFVSRAVVSRGDREIVVATVVWPKATFDSWWASARKRFEPRVETNGAAYTLPSSPDSSCTNDAWTRMPFADPDPRDSFTAVWTGAEMIVWGGSDYSYLGVLGNGARYNPATDTWTELSNVNAPAPRHDHTAVWTGSEMIVWGGEGTSTWANGARYSPDTDTWSSMSAAVGLAGRKLHTAVWTGTEMIVWGGSPLTNTGGRYNPSLNTWAVTSTGGSVPGQRYAHTAIWTGSQMIVWGGHVSVGTTNTGGRYDPSVNTWTATPMTSVPAARDNHTAVWTGTEMIVWGGAPLVNTGARYNPSTNTWTPTSTGANVPTGRRNHTAVWTGTEMIVWGGGFYLNSGGRYKPSTDTWTPTSTGASVPAVRQKQVAVWTGTEMIVWGGHDDVVSLDSGGRYDPSTNSWVATPTRGSIPEGREFAPSAWTGAELILWGGRDPAAFDDLPTTGARYDPALDTWTAISEVDAPQGREQQASVWTGKELIVWGGYNQGDIATGGRYDPATDIWRATSMGANLPSPRRDHSAIWTGTGMIVWGGIPGFTNTGGRYDPATDTWRPTSMGGSVPEGRHDHSAAWTGSRMFVWGGMGPAYLSTGGLYDPILDTWTATSMTGAPSARELASAVWTGSRVIVWGGTDGSPLGSGGVYDPVSDAWTTTSIAGSAPAGRSSHSALWSGSNMIVWGGWGGTGSVITNTGARYDPVADAWTATSTGQNVPAARREHTAVWTGKQMIAWGGLPVSSTGAIYCACPNGAIAYRDADGDGYGDPGASLPSCDGAIAAGYVGDRSDCNDASASVHPGVVETCDGLDNDCNGAADDGIAPPSASPGVTMARSGGTDSISWGAIPGATTYDVVEGDLAVLRASAGDFTSAVDGCVANDLAATAVISPSAPPPGAGSWLLVRGANCGGAGSYDEGVASQQGSRDAEVGASSAACP